MSEDLRGSVVVKAESSLKRMLVAMICVSATGLAIWSWLKQKPSFLPAPDSKPGRALLNQYQGITHDIWLVFLLVAAGYLIYLIYTSKQKEKYLLSSPTPGLAESCIRFINKNPLSTILLAGYALAMISGTTYLYKDLVGWYPDLLKGYFLDNFSIKQSFIAETMRRTDYRFFPLAHQDLHILSWFSIQIKTWMLVNALELVGIVLLCVKFLNGLNKDKPKNYSILLITALFLFHPSTGTAFYHVIYCERMLCLIFMLYINAYLVHLNTSRESALFSALLWALIGTFIKDIAILLFVIPAIYIWIFDTIKSRLKNKSSATFGRYHQMERWLCGGLLPIFVTSYIILALIPSSFASVGAYNENISRHIQLDFRFYLFAFISAARIFLILKRKIDFNLLDGINLAAFAYAIALIATFKFNSTSYLALPINLITTINIAWGWAELTSRKNKKLTNRKYTLTAALVATTIIGIDHATAENTFHKNVKEQKFEQAYVQSTYEKLDKIIRNIRESGDRVNIIINKECRLEAKRFLNQLPYHSLIEFSTTNNNNKYIIKDGAFKGSTYKPEAGDLIANLDKTTKLIDPISKEFNTRVLYRHNSSDRTGLILRIID